MTLPRVHRWFVSARATVVLLSLLAVLLLLNVVLPQAAVLGEERFGEVVAEGFGARLFLVDLGLGRMPTSPLFLSVLGLFFLNLSLVLVTRIGPTWRRIALRPRSETGLRAWARLEESLTAPLPEAWSGGDVARTLRGFGYHVRRAGERTFWGVKHRTAPLGFLLFHVSFFLLCAGGVWIYYTRFVGTAVLSEGQEFSGRYSEILRQPPIGGPPSLRFTVERIDPRFERGDPVHLGAVIRMLHAGSTVERTARVNHPARWGSTTILVERAGLAPVLWLQDAQGFTLDRVVAPVRTRGAKPDLVPLGDTALTARVRPMESGRPFPPRAELNTTPVSLQVLRGREVLFDGSLRPGQAAAAGEARLVLEEIRFWVSVRVISERGGSLLIIGFLAGVTGLVWRLLWYRREVAVTWDDRDFRLVGRSEYFSWRFREELRSVRSTLAGLARSGHSEGTYRRG